MSVLKNSNFFYFFNKKGDLERPPFFLHILHIAITMLCKAQMEYYLAAIPTLGCGL